MNQRDRCWATLIIWIVFAILFHLIFDRGLLVTADFAGLWPPSSGFPGAQDAEQLSQITASAREALPSVLAGVQQNIHTELALRVPIVIVTAVMLILAATLCTYFVWRNAGLEAYLAREVVQAEKAKRHSRIEQFVEDLDPDEEDQLRTQRSDEASAKLRR